MKRIILSVAVLATALANAQVGINEESPKATLDIKGKTDNTSDKVEGLLIPRVDKQKALKMGGNSELQESTMIYVNNTTFTDPQDGTEACVVDITENGYYFWNGTKWVKSAGSADGNTELPWIYNTDGNVVLNYANSNIEDIYKEKQHIIKSKDFDSYQIYPWEDITSPTPISQNPIYENALNIEAYNAKDIKNVIGGTRAHFSKRLGVIDNTVLDQFDKIYSTLDGVIVDATNTKDYDRIYNTYFDASHMGSGTVGRLIGGATVSTTYPRATVINQYGYFGQASQYSNQNSSNVIGLVGYASQRGGGEVSNLIGVRSIIDNKTSFATGNINRFIGFNAVQGLDSDFTGSIQDVMGLYVSQSFDSSVNDRIQNNYGIHINSITSGINKYAIYTNLGDIRFGQLADDNATENRLVAVDADGKLVIGSSTSNTGLWENNVTDQLVKLKATSDGTTPRTDDKNVFITDDGYVGIGNSLPTRAIHVQGSNYTKSSIALERNHAVIGAAATLEFNKSRGTNTAKTAVVDRDALGSLLFRAYNGTDYISSAQISSRVDTDGNIENAQAIPASLFFSTTNDGEQDRSVKMTLNKDGKLGIGMSNRPLYSLSVSTPHTGLNYTKTDGIFLLNKLTLTEKAGIRSIGGVEISSDFEGNFPSSGVIAFKVSNQEHMRVTSDGNVGIGTEAPTEKLEVAGKVKATAFIGTNGASIFPDYVFQKYYTGESSIKVDYNFNTLEQVESFVKQNGHLPGYTSAKEIAEKGLIDLGATQLTNVEKIEELYLHTIEQAKELKAKTQEIEDLKAELVSQKERFENQQQQINELKVLISK